MRSLLIILMAVAIAFADGKIKIAVNDLDGQGIEKSEAAVISERLRVELINTQSFRVMERAEMKSVLLEQGFQQTDCVDNSCIVQMGQLLGVEHMVMGNIGRVGSLYTVSIRLVNVATGEVLYTAAEDCRCTIEEVLTNSTKNIAMKLDLAIEKSIFGVLDVRTVPDFADVSINGKVIGKTNYLNDRFVPGSYRLTVSKPSYEIIEKELTVEQKKKVTFLFELNHTKQYADSVKTANRRQRIRAVVVRQVVIGALALAAGGAGYYYNGRAAKDITDENSKRDAYTGARPGADFYGLYDTYQTARQQTAQDLLVRNILYGVSGAVGIGFCISFAF